MFIPEWVFWVLGVVVTIAAANHFGKSQGDYDFVSPFIAIGIILTGVAFAVGYLIGT